MIFKIFKPRREVRHYINKLGCLCTAEYINGKPVRGKIERRTDEN